MAEETIEQIKALQFVMHLEMIYHQIQKDGYHPYLVEAMGTAAQLFTAEYNAKYVSPDKKEEPEKDTKAGGEE